MGVCGCSMFCCTLLCVRSSIAIILMGKRELVALLNLSYWCLVMVDRLFLAVPQDCLRFVIVVFHDHTHLLFCVLTIKYSRAKFWPVKCIQVPLWPRAAICSKLVILLCLFFAIVAQLMC